MQALLSSTSDYVEIYQRFGRDFPNVGYGFSFREWLQSKEPKPYNSFGNGSAMRVSPIGWYCNNIEDVMSEARRSAEVTHNHPEGIKGAQATAAAVFLARTGKSKLDIKQFVEEAFEYDLNRRIDDIRPNYKFDISCQGSVPESIIAFLESTDFENAIRLAISIGGDSDTIACITGGIAEAYYGEMPMFIVENILRILPNELVFIVNEFSGLINKNK